jgi:putative membrane-bound dehydrogenase-like protein
MISPIMSLPSAPRASWIVVTVSLLCLLNPPTAHAALRAGAYAQDITPKEFPVIVNGGFTEVIATKANDTLHARAIVLDDGREKLALVVVDSCMLPRELLDDAKARAAKLTGIPPDRMLISATHSHTAPSSMGCLGSDADANYVKTLPDLLARAIQQADKRLAPAQVAFTVVNDPDHTAARRWVFRPDRMRKDPFGDLTVRANMHPGYLAPDAIGPTGPIDPGLSVLAIRHADGKPLALLANYSMHYVGTTPLSADYYGRFCDDLRALLKADDDFVGVMSQGTSGDMWLADYAKPKPTTRPDIDSFAQALATEVTTAIKDLKYHDADFAMTEATLTLKRRVPDAKRLAWAKEKVAALGDNKPKTQPDIYAREAIFLHDEPQRELKLQAVRIGDVAIAAIPNEIYALTGLKIKATSPLPQTFTIGLANGSEGYIPPPEQHKLGGYTTWPARTAALEPEAEPKIVRAILPLLETVTGRHRRTPQSPVGPYASAVLDSHPDAYWRMDDFAGPVCRDATPHGLDARYEDGVLFYLPGAPTSAITGDAEHPSRAAHFAGGRVSATVDKLEVYSVEFFFWNGLSNEARPVTAYLFSNDFVNDPDGFGDHFGIAGTLDNFAHTGRLFVYNGKRLNQLLVGKTPLAPRTWYHVVFSRKGDDVQFWLNGKLEIDGQLKATGNAGALFFGGRSDNYANLEGKLDEISFYSRVLSRDEVIAHFEAAALPGADAQPFFPTPNDNPKPPPATSPTAPRANAPSTQSPTTGPTRHPPRSPADSMKSIHIPPDLAIELVASEPLIASPVAIDWGNDGKLWVVEMADYPYGMDGKGKPGGRIQYLESTSNNGTYDKSTLFLDNIKMPNGIIAWGKGVIVTSATEIFYAEDTDHDGKADQREVLFRGFKEGNPQLRENGLRWGIDNWLYVASGLTGGVVESVKTHQKLDLKGHDLRIRPDTGEMELVSGPSQFGREHDDAGQWFGTDNSHPLFHYVLDDHYLRRNPHLPAADPKQQLLPLPLPPVFPKSPFAKRYIGLDHHGHFTSACGISIYRDDLLFSAGDGTTHAFICEPVHNLVQHQVLTPAGVTFKAQRVEGEKNADFIAGEDNWFRPVMTRCGPDGAIYVVDMYRYMIEHPDWLNAVGKAELAPYYRDGAQMGRIYRLFPKTVRPRAIPRLAGMNAGQLVSLLESPSGYLRDRAQMMLVTRADPSSLPLLETLFKTSSNPLARLHALCTLSGIAELKPEVLTRALSDPDPVVRVHALRLAEPRLVDENVLRAATNLISDTNPHVLQQLARSLGESSDPRAGATLATLARSHGDELWPDLLSSATPHYAALLDVAAGRAPTPPSAFFEKMVEMAANRGDRPALARLLARLFPENFDNSFTEYAALATFLQTLTRGNHPLARWMLPGDDALTQKLKTLPPIIEVARKGIAGTGSVEERQAYANLLGYLPDRADDDLAAIRALLTPQTPAPVSAALIRAAVRTSSDAVPPALLKNWASYAPSLRTEIADVLLPRESWALALAQSPAARDLDFSRRQRLLNHPSAKVKEAAKTTLAQATVNADRQKVIDTYQPALTLKGDPAHGQALFAEHCATCHRVGASPVGHDIGPNLLTVRDWPAENLLTALLDPDRNVEPRFVAYAATLNDGSTLTGLLTGESAGNVILKTLDDQDHPLPRPALKSLTSTERSLMPQGFESVLSPQDVADLMSYLKSPTTGE